MLGHSSQCYHCLFYRLLVVDKATEDYYRKLDIIVSKDLPTVDRRSSSIGQVESHAEPDSAPEASGKVATFKIEEDDDEGVEEETSYQRRLSSRSSTTSTEKVKISYLCYGWFT